MKKSFAFFILLAAALPGFCASTCETRVDKHQDASTRERVAYCLTPETESLDNTTGPELVYYGVSSNEPEEETAQQGRRRQIYFDKDGVAVSQDYVWTKKFPPFANDTLSEQERLALEQAEKEALEKAQKEAAKKAATERAPLRTPSVIEEKEPVMTAAQLAARKTKPKRFMKEPAQEPASVQTPAEPVSYAPDPYGAAPYPTGTPQGELQDVQSLDNDPLLQNSGTAGGAAPEGFLDDNLMADDPSFGYNNTDPAMQP